MTRATPQTEATAAALLLREDPDHFRLAIGAAVLLHLTLLSFHRPEADASLLQRGEVREVIPIAVTPRFERHEPDEPPPPRKPRAVQVPIPDPTPDDPEPLRTLAVEEEPVPVGDVVALPVAIPEPPPPDDTVYEVGGEVDAPVKLSGATPRYTRTALIAHLEGPVVLEAIIDPEGRVTELVVVRPLGLGLDESAQEAVAGWRFRPATRAGKPVAVRYVLRVDFRIQGAR